MVFLEAVGVKLIVSRVDFRVFVVFVAAVGVREYCYYLYEYCGMEGESRLEALYFVRCPRATRALRATNALPSGLLSLDLAESRQRYVRGAALNREPPKLRQAWPLFAK